MENERISKSVEHDDAEGKADARACFMDGLEESMANVDRDSFDFGIYTLDTGDTVAIGMVGSNKDIAATLMKIITENKNIFGLFSLMFIPMIKSEIVKSLAEDIKEAESKVARTAEVRTTNLTIDPQRGHA